VAKLLRLQWSPEQAAGRRKCQGTGRAHRPARYIGDPHAPWQRGSNDDTNGLLRRYLPKDTDLAVFSQTELDAIATRLNSRPRRTLGFATPDEVFSALVDKAANAVRSPNAEGVRYRI
jgi:hypothetical protein